MMQNLIGLYFPTTNLGKIMERLIRNRLSWYLEKKLFNKSFSEWL